MKICIISFDFWGYDAHIITALRKKGIETSHINIGSIEHNSWKERLINTLSKIFFKKNLKEIRRQEWVSQRLKKLGKQDQILVVAPHSFEKDTIQNIRNYTDKMIAFLYDNLERYPVQDKLFFFDKIFSFDDKDVEKFGFEKITNYNYLHFLSYKNQSPQYDVLYITSREKKRLAQLKILSKKFEEFGLKFKIFMIVKKFWRNLIDRILYRKLIIFKNEKINHEELPEYYKDTKVMLDLIRENQRGLSFRVFEAMALEKKIITDNEKIKGYDFYNPNNILVLNEDFSNLNKDFFERPYESLPKEIYEKYTLKNWVKKVFDLK